MKKVKIFALSDSIGETSEQVSKAVLNQFSEIEYEIDIWSYIQSKEQINEAVFSAKKENAVIVFTLVIVELRDYLLKKAAIEHVTAVDLITPLLTPMIEHIGFKPKREPGLLYKFDENYFKRMDAIDFAVKYDDGKDTRGVLKADIVLIGISRTSKTPLSMYLANKSIKMANIPLVPEVEPPEELFSINPERIVALYADPDYLNKIRKERLKVLGLNDNSSYADSKRIIKELEYADIYIKKIGCRKIDITNKAIEEIANMIINWHIEITRKERE
jgi:[pyruvate, water dikinase]-phosphate phosphotransferase / [pyruvate, water dikinase] kinase